MTETISLAQPVSRPTSASATKALLHALMLLATLAVAAYLRLNNINWDDGQHLHPDERFLTQVENGMQPVSSIGEYFDTFNSTLNPNNVGFGLLAYGNFPLIITRYVGQWLDMTEYHNIHLVGRVLSALYDLMTICLLYMAGRRLYDKRIGLLAAAFYSFAALPIQQAHFFTVDALTNTLVAAAFLFAVFTLEEHRWLDYILFGLMLGLAVASKINVFPLASVIVLATLVREWPTVTRAGGPEAAWRNPHTKRLLQNAALGLVVAGVVSLAAFRVAMPYAFLPPGNGNTEGFLRLLEPLGISPNPLWVQQIRELRFIVSGQWDAPPNHQWASRPVLIFPWLNITRFGLGWPLGLAAWAGFAWAIWEMVRRNPGWRRHALPVAWITILFVWLGTAWVMSMRYFLPLYPFLALLAAWALFTLKDRIAAFLATRRASPRHWANTGANLIMASVTIGAMGWGFAFSQIYTRPVTRIAASDWMYENVPADITLTVQTDEGPRPVQVGLLNHWLPPDIQFDEVTAPALDFTYIEAGGSKSTTFTAQFSGTVTDATLFRVVDPLATSGEESLRLTLSHPSSEAGNQLVSQELNASFKSLPDDARGRSYHVVLEPYEIVAGQTYLVTVEALEGPLALSGGVIAWEGEWDDPIPLPNPNYNAWGAQFHPLGMQMAWGDTPDKRTRWQYVLDHADYIVLTSNRFYGSLPRIPDRFPMTIDYYEALFDGTLGFELVGDFNSDPNLGPLRFSDQQAEEAFTVYDHPRVLLFRKTDDYSSANTNRILTQANLDEVVLERADQVTDRPVILEPPSLPTRRSASAWNSLFNRGNLLNTVQPLGVLVWWLMITLLGWLAFPTLFVGLRGLPDKGYAVARVFGLLFVSWLGWILASVDLLPWTRLSVWLCVAALAALSAGLGYTRRREIVTFVRDNKRHLLLVEGITLVLFVAFLLVRLGNPDLWHPAYGGEKPMDMAYFNAVLKTNTFPPYDPWFAGGTINYYYYGFVLIGVPVKLLGIAPTIAYNLILPTLYALTGTGAFSAAFSLAMPSHSDDTNLWRGGSSSQAYLAGAAALIMAIVLGNLDQIRTVLYALAEVGGHNRGYGFEFLPPLQAIIDGLSIKLVQGGPLPIGTGSWYWNATRVIPVPLNEAGISTEAGPITEFPLFTFLYADLHAHMIALPLGMLALVWTVAQIRPKHSGPDAPLNGLDVVGWFVSLFIGALAIGVLRPTNTWDYPGYLLLGAGGLLLGQFARAGASWKSQMLHTGLAVLQAAALVGLTIFLFRPYIENYETAYTTFVKWEGSSTKLWAYLDVHGLFLFVLVAFFVQQTRDWFKTSTPQGLQRARYLLQGLAVVVLATAGITVYLATNVTPVALIAIPLAVWALILIFRPGQSSAKRAVLAMVAMSLGLTLFVELFVLSGDISRMNTVFKFYIQVWLQLSVAAGAALAWLWPSLREWRPAARQAWLVGLALLVALAATYPITATIAKISDRWEPDAPRTLDGMDYMQYVSRSENGVNFSLDADYDALRWMQDNIEDTPVILEGHTGEYHWGSRVSIYTGLPAVVGWNWHQRQQRSTLPGDIVFGRVNDVGTLYDTTDQQLALALLDQYGVEYIMVGGLEQALYTTDGLAKFEQMAEDGRLDVVYSQDGTVIYRVLPAQD